MEEERPDRVEQVGLGAQELLGQVERVELVGQEVLEDLSLLQVGLVEQEVQVAQEELMLGDLEVLVELEAREGLN